MASSSSSSHIAPRSCKYDVFLSFRGEDTRKTFVDHLYSALKEHLISVYKDDETLQRGESINQSLLEAIEESQMAVIIFSKNYADSSWCLDELTHIMKCKDEKGLIVIPIFYDVEPTEVRNQKRKFGKAFAKQKAKNVHKVELWRNVLVDVCNIAGWEPKNIANGRESQFIKEIVDTILGRLFLVNSCVDEDLVGMRERFHDMKLLLDIGSGDVRMIGIWGVGGGGKTTLATSIYMDISKHFQGHCIIENVREETSKNSLYKLQEKILSALFKQEVKVHSLVEGKHMLKSRLCNRRVLVVLDDVDKLDQLEALAGKHNWFGSGSRIIFTTRDQHLLSTHKVDHVYPIKLLSCDEATWLFKRYAYNEKDPVEDYESLSSSVISYCAGLPLAIKVLGSFLYDKNKTEWTSAMNQLKDIPEMNIVDKLKISFDGLKIIEKELFLDLMCFFRRMNIGYAKELLEACGYCFDIGIKVLRQKALITVVDGMLDMHDLVQEMGHYIVRGEHPNNPEKHSRLWKYEVIKDLPFHDETMEYDKIEATMFRCPYDYSRDDSSRLCKIVSNMRKLRLLIVILPKHTYKNAEEVSFLSNELRYIEWTHYPPTPFPHSFEPVKLVFLILIGSMQKEVWKGYKHLPSLRVLELKYMEELRSTPDFDGLPLLQKLVLGSCYKLEEIHPSLGNNTSLEYLNVSFCSKLKRIPTISQMKNIKTLIIRCSLKDGEIPLGIGDLSNLQELNLSHNNFSQLDFSFSQLTQLKCLNVSDCYMLLELPVLPSSLAVLTTNGCRSLKMVKDFNKDCKELCQVSLDKYEWSNRLLQSMLKVKAIQNGCMCLFLEGIEIPKVFKPPLLKGRKCRLKLPENWFNDYSGFLICAISDYYMVKATLIISTRLSLKHASHVDDDDNTCKTLVWYVSFGSLRDTTWWDQTHKSLVFKIRPREFVGLGVRLVKKKSSIVGLEKTSTIPSSTYTPQFMIKNDSSSELRAELVPYYILRF